MEIWQPSRLEPETIYRWAIGPLLLWLRSVGDELHLATQRGDELEHAGRTILLEPADDPPEALEWTRWVTQVETPGAEIQVLPIMPDRPAVARPDSPVRLPVGSTALFFLSIPVFVRLISLDPAVAGEAGVTLTEMPSVVLSNIWFGEPTGGELCYSLKTTARRRVEDTVTRPHRAVCPVFVRNDAKEELLIQRLRVQLTHLTVFDAGSRLWTNRVNVAYRGERDGAEITIAPGAPEQAEGRAVVVGQPRQILQQRVWTRVFTTVGSMF